MKPIIFNKEHLFLFIILLLASILRFYNAFDIPFTHDELSALFRANFDSFSELINGGVLTDTHPAGVQIFYYYWIYLFGASEFAIKFPFILMGIGSVYWIWKIANNWYNSSVAFIISLFLATLAYPIMYSQIARPYISGLFLTLWMVYHWSYYLFKTTSKINKHLIYYIIVSALCTYNHHFTLLFAFSFEKDPHRLALLFGILFLTSRSFFLPSSLIDASFFVLNIF